MILKRLNSFAVANSLIVLIYVPAIFEGESLGQDDKTSREGFICLLSLSDA